MSGKVKVEDKSPGFDIVVVLGRPSADTSSFFNSIKFVRGYIYGGYESDEANGFVDQACGENPDMMLLNWYVFEDTRFNDR